MRAYLFATTLLASSVMAAPPAIRSPGEIVAAAPASAWQEISPENMLVMELAGGGRVVIELAPGFAPVHIANIRALVRDGWFDGGAIVRVQDNYVVQWAGRDEKRPMPAGVSVPAPAEYDRPLAGMKVQPIDSPDPYAATAGFVDGWPVGSDGKQVWLAHCYSMVGVGRDMPPDTGSGAELYAVIGQAPRHLDRNIALVGRIVEGMERLSPLPRGTGDLGFYTDPGQRVAIQRIRDAADMPPAERPRLQVMRTDSPAFTDYLSARANRRDAFFVRPAGGVDLCNAPVPVRSTP